jgi:hypothetical protein
VPSEVNIPGETALGIMNAVRLPPCDAGGHTAVCPVGKISLERKLQAVVTIT